MDPSILDMTIDELHALAARLGQPAYRADQLADWLYRKAVTDPRRMTNLPGAFASAVRLLTSRVAARSDSADGTIKLLLALHDGEQVETALIPTARRATACVSTQAGCGVGCAFCASGMHGLRRNLTCAEILEQVLHLRQAAARGVTHVVFMGVGEPLANYDATISAVRALIDPRRFALSARHVTISTVGLPKRIRRLARTRLPVTLAISLHAPNDVLRRKLIPNAAPLGEVLDAARAFYRSRRREITLEYVLLAGVNDTQVCAEALARLAKQLRCNVNLIAYNPVASLPFRRPSQRAVRAFAQRLRHRGVNAQVRRSRGLDASAACGQLRSEAAGGPPRAGEP